MNTINFIKAGIADGYEENALRAFAAYETDDENEEIEWLTVERFSDAYCGHYASDEDFARDLADDLHGDALNNLEWPFRSINWEDAAGEIMADYYSENGFYFHSL